MARCARDENYQLTRATSSPADVPGHFVLVSCFMGVTRRVRVDVRPAIIRKNS